ncbi:tRNA pseudouridine synthase A 1 [Tetrabaena socialis]|uniref:tRNA pseudouridine synthase n=1 Tax=Tetrabaena socialis TaxID=47790 RepID=A0A2J8ABF2_9CHLO|nr:tRNA pseudouridine synthase A 1 [Tetrabaena socialis]|eukprot:PNH09854.1 tRNA pseudouridine synthase A 1 [Tetrabaena socialis]
MTSCLYGRLGRLSYRLLLSYDGTDYCGWQLQPGLPTVQGCLEAALGTLLKEERGVLGVRGAGRTDSGVHARGQVVQFVCNREVDSASLPYKLNALLPRDIRVLHMARTAPDFSVTCSALGKCYHYSITNAEAYDPLRYRFAMHVRKPMDLAAMRGAAALLQGTHDFTQLSNTGEAARRRDPIKTLRRVAVVELGEAAPGGLRIEVEGNGFLYKMVRHIAGVLVAIGEGRLPVAALSGMLAMGANAPPGLNGKWRGYNVAPAKGLCLHQVHYDPRVDDPTALLYPELPHDEHGRLLGAVPGARSDEE